MSLKSGWVPPQQCKSINKVIQLIMFHSHLEFIAANWAYRETLSLDCSMHGPINQQPAS